jgi:flagellar biosynthesis component FlhA
MGSPIFKHKYQPLLNLSHTIFVLFSEAIATKITQISNNINVYVVRENNLFQAKNCYFLVSRDQVIFMIVRASTIKNVPFLCLASLLVVNAWDFGISQQKTQELKFFARRKKELQKL